MSAVAYSELLDDEKLALATLQPPFRYDAMGQAVVDRENSLVLDVRGWGRIQYLDNAERRHDAIGRMLARMLNERVAQEGGS